MCTKKIYIYIKMEIEPLMLLNRVLSMF